MEYDLPGRRPSMSETSRSGWSPTASRVMARRTAKGVSSPGALCGGCAAGMNQRRLNDKASQTSSAARRWPKWMGLKVPPKRPSLSLGSSSDLAVAINDELGGGKLFQAHGPEGVQL